MTTRVVIDRELWDRLCQERTFAADRDEETVDVPSVVLRELLRIGDPATGRGIEDARAWQRLSEQVANAGHRPVAVPVDTMSDLLHAANPYPSDADLDDE